jgi:hypothetical protein
VEIEQAVEEVEEVEGVEAGKIQRYSYFNSPFNSPSIHRKVLIRPVLKEVMCDLPSDVLDEHCTKLIGRHVRCGYRS